jgi:hypothetical protein
MEKGESKRGINTSATVFPLPQGERRWEKEEK